jgi:hypothetical protein
MGGAGIPGMPMMPGMGVMPGMAPLSGVTRIVVLENAVELEELSNPSDYDEILTDMEVRWVRFSRGCLV